MRTSVEIPDELHEKFRKVAAQKRLKGFSTIIVDALEKYFAEAENRDIAQIKSLRGSITGREATELLEDFALSRANSRRELNDRSLYQRANRLLV